MKISSLSLTFLFLFMGISNAIGSFGGGGVSEATDTNLTGHITYELLENP